MQVAVPKTLWDTLQATFVAEGKKLCRDIAPVLGKSEKEIIQKLLSSPPKIQLAIISDEDRPLSCPVLLHRKNLYERCRQTCILGTSRCVHHQEVNALPEVTDAMTHLTRIQRNRPEDPALWCDETTHEVYDREGNLVGIYEDESLLLFETTNELEESDVS